MFLWRNIANYPVAPSYLEHCGTQTLLPEEVAVKITGQFSLSIKSYVVTKTVSCRQF